MRTTSDAQYDPGCTSRLQRHADVSLRAAVSLIVSLASLVPSAIAFGEIAGDDVQRVTASGQESSCKGIWPKPWGLACLGFALKHLGVDAPAASAGAWPRAAETRPQRFARPSQSVALSGYLSSRSGFASKAKRSGHEMYTSPILRLFEISMSTLLGAVQPWSHNPIIR